MGKGFLIGTVYKGGEKLIIQNETVASILNRRSIRSYQKTQITSDELETILEAGSYAPSGMNQQSARAVVVQGADRMQELVQLAQEVTHKPENPFYDAPTVILVFAKSSNLTPTEDGCLAIENMFLAAQSLGIGTCWIYASKMMFSHPNGRQFQKKLGVSEDYSIVGAFAAGYPDGVRPQPKPRAAAFYTIV